MTERPQNKYLKPFKPGQSGNPSGRSREILTKDKVAIVLGRFANATREKLQEVISNPDTTMLELMVASIMVKAAKDGDPYRLEFLLQRSIGKVTDVNVLDVKHWSHELKAIPIETLKEISKKSETPE